MKKVILGLFLLILTSFISVFALENINFGNGFVSDGANVIRYRDKALLNMFLWDLHNKTTSDIAVVTLPTLKGQYVEDKAMYINRAFRVGGYGKDNGVVVVIVPKENKVAISTGYNVDDAIPDLRKKQIINEVMLPSFNRKFYSKGIVDGIEILAIDVANYHNTKISGLEYKKIPPMPKTFIETITPINWAIGILFLVAGIILYLITKKPDFDCYYGFGGDFRELDRW